MIPASDDQTNRHRVNQNPGPDEPLTAELRDTLARLAICSEGLVDLGAALALHVSHLNRFAEQNTQLDQCSASLIAASDRLSSYLNELAGEVTRYASFYEDVVTEADASNSARMRATGPPGSALPWGPGSE